MAIVACDGGPSKRDEPVEGWPLAKAALLDGSNCYGKTPLLCLDDPAYIDASIQEVLDEKHGGTMPSIRGDVDAVIRSARSKYRARLQTEEGLKAQAARVREVYDNPTADTQTVPGTASYDLGALPGPLRDSRRNGPVVLASSDLMDGFEWSAAEAGRRLAQYAKASPDAAVIRLEVRAPRASKRHWVYRYIRKTNVIIHGDAGDDSVYVSNPIPGGLETMAAGKLTLGKADGKTCYAGRRSFDNDCPYRDPVYDKQRKARREAR